MIQQGQTSDEDKVRATLVIGEIGVFKDLSSMKDIIRVMSKLFESQNDQIRQAAAISLGSVSIGNTDFFLEQVFNMIQ